MFGAVKATVWLHGSALRSEGETGLTIQYKDDGAYILSTPNRGNTAWFHFDIPNPACFSDTISPLSRVMILYNTLSEGGEPINGGAITHVRLYDGVSLINAFDDLQLSGWHLSGHVDTNTFRIDPPHVIVSGLRVSICYRFAPDIVSIPFHIASIGADFLSNELEGNEVSGRSQNNVGI